jgi:hypothetical protein
MPLDVESSRRIVGIPALKALLEAVEKAAKEDEDEFVEWKSGLDLATAHGRFTVSKAILALANRDPAIAARRFEGCGYVIVGVEPGSCSGVTPLDPADLSANLDRYVGGVEGPVFELRYVEYKGVQVLVVTVEPPRPGDPGFPLRRAFDKFDAGTLFHRRKGLSSPANPAEIAMLFRRVRHSDPTPFEIEGRIVPDEPLTKLNVLGFIAHRRKAIAERADELREAARRHHALISARPDSVDVSIRDLIGANSIDLSGFGVKKRTPDTRTLDDYLAEVDSFEAKMVQWLDRSWTTVAWDQLDDVFLEITNATDTYLTGLRVEVRFDDERIRCFDHEPEEEEAPSEPHPFGEDYVVSSFPDMSGLLANDFGASSLAAPEWTTSIENNAVVFDVGKLHPRGVAFSEPLRIVVPVDIVGAVVTATGSATAEGHHRIVNFRFETATDPSV